VANLSPPVQAASAEPQSARVRFTFGQLLAAARHGHREFRSIERLQRHLGWKNRKVLALEKGRLRPTATDIAELTSALPLLRVLLDRARPQSAGIRDTGESA